MKPLKFNALLKSTLWGGEKIIPFKNLDVKQENVGESWEISGVKNNETIVSDGPYAGKKLNEVVAELKGKKRNAEIVLPRQIVMYLCRNMTDTPLKSIGALLGGKDHASISHGVKKIEQDMKTDEALNNTINIIRKKINPI